MANLFTSTLFLLNLLFCFYVENSVSFSFNFPPQTDFRFYRDAIYQQGAQEAISLTRNSTPLYPASFGWATYNKPVPLWDNSSQTLSNFSTHFQFVIGKASNSSAGGGLAFFMAPFHSQPPASGAIGWWLGLFNGTTEKLPTNQIVAVEFDTFKDHFDLDDNHVGIDVNSIVSQTKTSLSRNGSNPPGNETLKNGAYWDAWVDYNGGTKQLQVFLLYNPSGNSKNISKPENPILGFDIDLRDYLPEKIRVGFSASTYSSRYAISESHTVYAWNFTSSGISSVISGKKASNHSQAKVPFMITILGWLFAVSGFIFAGWCWYLARKKTQRRGEESDMLLDERFAQRPRRFSYAELSAATQSFSEDEKLGEGGFGGVYRGILPGTNEAVAVKKISEGSRQGKKEYVSEVTIISRLRHRNLVQLLGWCHENTELLLVYEFLKNGSLDEYLFDQEKDPLDWDRRYRIACDIASALVYLHEDLDQRIVHRDVKASNVMLDSNFNAKLGDFGLARLVEHDRPISHTTSVAGTLGYLAPEWAVRGKATSESDVFSFGAVALEIACGRRPMDWTLTEHNCRLVEWVWYLYKQGKLVDAADERLGGNSNAEEMERLMLVGLLCSQREPKARPEMRHVVKILRFDVELPYIPLNLYDDSLPVEV